MKNNDTTNTQLSGRDLETYERLMELAKKHFKEMDALEAEKEKETSLLDKIDFEGYDRWKEYIKKHNEAEVAKMTAEEKKQVERLYSAMDSVEDDYFG